MGRINSKRGIRLNEQAIPYDGVGYCELMNSAKEVIGWISQSKSSIELKQLAKEVLLYTDKFATAFFRIKDNLKAYHLGSFVDACKSRSDDLMNLLSTLSKQGEEVTIVVVTSNNEIQVSSLRYLRSKVDIYTLSEVDEDDIQNVYTIHSDPKFYSHLMVGMLKVMQRANHLRNVNKQEFDYCMRLSLLLVSFSRIYLEFRSNIELWDAQEEKIFVELQREHQLDTSSHVYTVFQAVVADIKEGKLPYIQEMRRAIDSQQELLNSPFSEKDYYYSGRSTPSSVKGWTKQVSLVSSAWEVDPFVGHPIDEEIGYVSRYNKNAPKGYSDPGIATLAINQHKLKARIIHLASNPIQDRCNYLRRRLASILKNNPCDCTVDQFAGVSFALKVTSPLYREKNKYPGVLCLDFSNATDLLDQQFQCECLELIFNKPIVQFWKDISKLPKEFRFRKGFRKLYKQLTGQPQGILGSFDSFALAHHLIMLMVMRMCGLTKTPSREFYRILGDDSIINTVKYDPDGVVLESYMEVCSWANLDINVGKSHITRSEDKIALAEFAKVTVLDGEIMSPPPIRILSRVESGTTNYYSFTTAIWMLEHGFDMPDILQQLLRKWFGYDSETLLASEVLMFGGIIPQFAKFHQPGRFSDEQRSKLALCYLVTKIKGTIAENLLSDKQREDLSLVGYKLTDAIESVIPTNPDFVLDQIEDLEHKLLIAINKNLLLEDSIKSILGLSDTRLLLPLIDLTEDEIRAIFTVSDCLALAEVNQLDGRSLMSILTNSQVMKSLDRFQMRSFHKHTAREISYLSESLDLNRILFHSVT